MAANVEEMLDLVKSNIQFTTPEGEYEGIVRLVCPVTKKLIVEKIIFLPKQLSMGTLTFHFHEILSYFIIRRPQSSDVDSKEQNCNTFSYIPTRTNDACVIDDEQSEFDDDADENVCFDELLREEEYVLKIPRYLSSKLPVDSIVIDKINEEFHLALKHVRLQASIGVCLEGPKLDRHGILSWLAISTASCTFLFDIENLGQEAFSQGLKSILENPSIEKIIHDCRQPSDCLYHMYGVKLVNVFDTQVADLLVTMQQSRDTKVNKHASSLHSCLRSFLEVPEEYLYKPKTFKSYDESILFYRLRPLKNHQRDVMMKNVIYLRLLKSQLDIALLNPFRRAVGVYLQSLQAFTDRELLLRPIAKEEVPPELHIEGIQVVRFSEFVKVPPVVSSGPPYRQLKDPVEKYMSYCDQYRSSCTDLIHNAQSHIQNNDASGILAHETKTDTSSEKFSGDIDLPFKILSRLNNSYAKENTNLTTDSVKFYNLDNNSTKETLHEGRIRLMRNCNNFHVLDDDAVPSKMAETDFSVNQRTFSEIDKLQSRCLEEDEANETPESMSSTSDPSEDDIWATLRAQTVDSDECKTFDRKLKFVPAGMWKEG